MASPLTLSLDEIRARPPVTIPVTLECAGNGRARLHPRPVSQPWLNEAVGTAEWTGTALGPLLRAAGVRPDAVDVVFTGIDHGVERGVVQDYQRGLPLAEALRDEALLAYEMNGAPLPPQHGFPLRLVMPGWYGMAHVKWLNRITVQTEAFTGYQNRVAYRLKADADDRGEPVTRIRPRALMIPPGHPGFHVPQPFPATRHPRAQRPGLVRAGPGDPGRRLRRHWTDLDRGPGRAGVGSLGLVALAYTVDGDRPGTLRAAGPRDRRQRRGPAGRSAVESAGDGEQHDPTGRGARRVTQGHLSGC